MNLKTITAILAMPIEEKHKKNLILQELASDSDVIPNILYILESERKEGKELLLDTNSELSRALVTLQDPNIGKVKPKPYIELSFVIEEIKKHYLKWEHRIKCCFKIDGLP